MTAASTIRVLECGSDLAVAYAGWLLARMGAVVTHVGAVAAPATAANPVRLALEALRASKQVAPAPDTPAGWDVLFADHDIVLLPKAPHAAPAPGEPDAIHRRAPHLTVGVSSIFGLTGPLSDVPATALDAQAMSSMAWALGEPGRAPLALPPGIVEHQAGAMLAAGSLAALTMRDTAGAGRIVDIALADVLATYVAGNCRFYIHHGLEWRRSGRRASGSGGAYPFVILSCKDGDVCVCGRTRDEWNRLVRVMGNPAWAGEPRYQDLRAMGKQYPEEGDALIAPWLARHTMAELEALALANGLIIAPVRQLDDVIATPHFQARQSFEEVTVAGGRLKSPALPLRAVAGADVTSGLLAAAPLRDQALRPHRERGGEAGAAAQRAPTDSAAKFSPPPAPSVPLPPGERDDFAPHRDRNRPFAHLRILDFGWVWSAPWVSTMLGELGAQVIKVEHAARPDNLRMAGRVFRDGVMVEGPSREMSPMYHQINHGKRGITLNLKDPRAVDLALRLADMSDLVVENMSPGAMLRAGLGYDALRVRNPRLVMLSMSAAGQAGPLRDMRAYAPTMSSFVGLEGLVGYADERPVGALNVALGDPNGSAHGLVAVLAALHRARLTGEGCHLDLSQVDGLLGILRPYLLQAQVTGAQPQPVGNAHPEMAPHGVYPAGGVDRWLTIAVADDGQWRALQRIADGASFAGDVRFAPIAGRIAHRAALDTALATWTAMYERDDLVTRLRAAGIASSPVLDIAGLWSDPHYAARGLRHPVTLPFYGEETLFRAPWRFSDCDPRIDRPGPTTGQHNPEVFSALLGLSSAEIADLTAAGVIA